MAKSRKRSIIETAVVIGGVFVGLKLLQNRGLVPTASGLGQSVGNLVGGLKNSIQPDIVSGAKGAESGIQTTPEGSQGPSGIVTEDEVIFTPGPTAGGTGSKSPSESGPFRFGGFEIDIPQTSVKIPTSSGKSFSLGGVDIKRAFDTGRLVNILNDPKRGLGFQTNRNLFVQPFQTVRGRNILVSPASAQKLKDRGILA